MFAHLFLHFFTIFGSSTGGPSTVHQAVHSTVQHYSFTPPPVVLSDSTFEKMGQDVRCGDGALQPRITVSTMSQCKQKCIEHLHCRYFAFWQKKKYCEIYALCTSQEPDAGNAISLYERLGLCPSELLKSKVASPLTAMVAQFLPLGTVRFEGPKRNMHCYCATSTWMVCSIIVNPESHEEKIVNARLDRRNEALLRPFYLIPSKLLDPEFYTICYDIFVDVARDLRIWNEVQVIQSTNCIGMNTCLMGTPEGICPITKEPFHPGEAVFVLNADASNARLGIPVPCYSFLGIRTIVTNKVVEQQGYFHDQLMRFHNRPMRESDYTLFIIVSEAQAAEGLCQVPAKLVMDARGDRVQSGPLSFQPDLLAAAQAFEESPKGEKRKNKKKKKKTIPGAASSSGVSPTDSAHSAIAQSPGSDAAADEISNLKIPSTSHETVSETQTLDDLEQIDWKTIIWQETFPDQPSRSKQRPISPNLDPWPGQKYIDMFKVSPDFCPYPVIDYTPPQTPFACSPSQSENSTPDEASLEDPCSLHSSAPQGSTQDMGKYQPSSNSEDDLTLEENTFKLKAVDIMSPRAEQPVAPQQADRLPPRRTPSTLNAPQTGESPPARPPSPVRLLNPDAPEFIPQNQAQPATHDPQPQRGRPPRSLRGRRTQRAVESTSPRQIADSSTTGGEPSSLIGCTVSIQNCKEWAALYGKIGIVEAETESEVIVKIDGDETIRVSRDCILFLLLPGDHPLNVTLRLASKFKKSLPHVKDLDLLSKFKTCQ